MVFSLFGAPVLMKEAIIVHLHGGRVSFLIAAFFYELAVLFVLDLQLLVVLVHQLVQQAFQTSSFLLNFAVTQVPGRKIDFLGCVVRLGHWRLGFGTLHRSFNLKVTRDGLRGDLTGWKIFEIVLEAYIDGDCAPELRLEI